MEFHKLGSVLGLLLFLLFINDVHIELLHETYLWIIWATIYTTSHRTEFVTNVFFIFNDMMYVLPRIGQYSIDIILLNLIVLGGWCQGGCIGNHPCV